MNHDCPTKSLLASFAVGKLGDDEFENVASHLHGCQLCNEQLSRLNGEDDLIQSLRQLADLSGHHQPTIDCTTRIVRSLDEDQTKEVVIDCGKRYSRLLKEGPCRLGRFELLEEIGCGSFGYVFQAYDPDLDRVVAIKIQRSGSIASAEQQRRFLHEARSAARLQHPSIVALYETGETEDGVCYLVTEFIAGDTLEGRIERSRFEFRDAAALMQLLAQATHYAHNEGIVHRDIKPSNILIDSNQVPHLADFGLAKRESPDETLASDGRVLGTPAYMPPEHARGCSTESDARSDIYSMGVILYELLTGERPFQGKGRLLLLQVLDEDPRPLRQLDERVPRDLETICLKAMAKQPARRYQTAEEFADDLRRYLDGEPITARPIGYTEKLQRWSARNPFAVALFAAILISSIAGFLYLRSLNSWIVQEMALDNSRLYADMLEEFNEYYSEIRDTFYHGGMEGALLGADVLANNSLGQDDSINTDFSDWNAPPLPATMRIEVAERISCNDEHGMKARVFSPHSFREELRPRDEFEHKTLNVLNKRISQLTESQPDDSDPVLEFFEFQDVDNQPVLKYARGQLMTASCIECHNTRPDSPRTDWEVGDLAGVFSLTRPLTVDVERAQEGVRGASHLVVSIALTLTVCGLLLAYRNKRRTY